MTCTKMLWSWFESNGNLRVLLALGSRVMSCVLSGTALILHTLTGKKVSRILLAAVQF